MKNAVVLAVHTYNSAVERKLYKLREELNERIYDVYLLYHSYEEFIKNKYLKDIAVFLFNYEDLNQLGYIPIAETLIPGSTHFPLLYFYKKHCDYLLYWFIEYDVDFKGSWNTLVEDCDKCLSSYDFLSCHIERFRRKRNSSWPWWLTSNNMRVPFVKCIKSFNPICRYSNRALDCLDQYLKQGHSAHSEVMIATCLYHHGMKIGDIGGYGEFVPEGWEDKYYLASEGIHNGTMRYRPVYTKEEIEKMQLKDKLFHPLKDFSL